jgi:hypothetical protein
MWVSVGMLVLGFGVLATMVGRWLYETDERVQFRVDEWLGQVREAVDPQPAVLPTAVQNAALPGALSATPRSTNTPSATPSASVTPEASATLGPTATPTLSPTPIPIQVTLTGYTHTYQLFNNCGPASLAMTLSYWQWPGDQRDIAAVVKPNKNDRNVSPRELYEFLLPEGYDAYIRVNGDVETLKRFVAAGYPVLVEKGYTCEPGERCNGWFGHYSVFTGYDDDKKIFYTQDSFRGPNFKLTYDNVIENWRAFNYVYLVVFPQGAEHDAKVRALLEEAADVDAMYRAALERAQRETQTLTGEELAFAWYNVGTNLVYFQDYAGAAAAFDEARAAGLPYRMLWYQFGPYVAYYTLSRYQEVVDLASFAIDGAIGEPGLEEAYYWRGLSHAALGRTADAIADYRAALERHPGYQPALDGLAALGATP